MKLISRKALTATIAAAAISTAALTAPAMAETTTSETTTTTTTSEKAPAEGSSDSDLAAGSSDFFTKTVDGKKVEMDPGEKIKAVVGILTGIASVFTALISISKNFDQITKLFQPR